MATTKYDTLLPYVLPEVHGCSDPLAEQAIRDAVIEFCLRARVWVHECDPADIDAGEDAYDIDLPSGAALVQIASVHIGDKPLDPFTGRQPEGYSQRNDDELVLVPTPDTTLADGLLVELIVKPSRASTGFPGWINERYQEGILSGAKARLMMKQGTAWYNPQQGAAYQFAFDTACTDARGDAAGALVGAPIRTTPHN
jgi:hypothetical protein